MNQLYMKHMLLRTPLERPAQQFRHLAGAWKRYRHPELHEVYLESDRIERALRTILQEDSNCIDIGCHIGSSLSWILGVAPKGKHIAVEPVPEKAAWLKKKFPEVEVRAIALGENPGLVKFYQNKFRPGFSGLSNYSADPQDVIEITVDCHRLDDVVCRDRIYTYIKMDVEGAELLVLKGARELVARDRPVILFESSHDGAAKLGLKREDLFHFLVHDLAYKILTPKRFLEHGDELDLSEFQKAAVYPFEALNFLALPG